MIEVQVVKAAEPDLSPQEELQTWRQDLVRGVLRAVAVVGFFVAAAATLDSIASEQLWTIPFYWSTYGVVLLLTFVHRTPYRLQVWVIVGLLYVLGVLDFVEDGPSGSGRAFMLIIPFIAGVFLGRRESVFALAVCSLTMAGFGVAFVTDLLVTEENIGANSLTRWIAGSLALFMLGLLIVIALDYVLSRLTTSLTQSRKLAQELAVERAGLEQAVTERTADLARRSTQLETAAQVAREAAAIQDLEQLLNETAHLISNRFGFYHTGIFLLDDTKTYAELRAASSEGGQRMLDRGHRLEVGEVGIVGHVTDQGEPRIVLDVGADAVFFDNPDLPATRSEMALPLRAKGEIIGALDVQSTAAEAFDDQDITVLQTLADQVALAISNAQLFQQARRSMEAERRAFGEAASRSWQQLLQSSPHLSRRYDPHGIIPNGGQQRADVKTAAREGQIVVGEDGSMATIAIPLKVRDHVIGILDAHKPAEAGAWTPDEIALMETLTQQLSLALEGARQRQDTQNRAIRERLTREIAARMRETLDVETVMQTAVRQMRETLDLAEVEVRIGTGPLSDKA
jgi:GAF domain-containing protein